MIENPRFPPSLVGLCLVINIINDDFLVRDWGVTIPERRYLSVVPALRQSSSMYGGVVSFSATEIASQPIQLPAFWGLQFSGPVGLLDFVIQQPQFLGKAIHCFLYFLHIYRAENFNLCFACPVSQLAGFIAEFPVGL